MSKGFEKIYSQKIRDFEKKEEDIKIEISEEEFEMLGTIAKIVGGDFGMKIKLGKPGEGSFFDLEECSITFDPLHIKENLDKAKFVAGHEGGHRAITLSPKRIGLKTEKINEYYSQLGFSYLQNVIEDPAVNTWLERKFPKLKEYIETNYDEQFKKEDAILYGINLSIKEAVNLDEEARKVKEFYDKHGYWPRFIQYGSEIIRDWHQKRFSRKLDKEVEKVLKRTIKYARESIQSIPILSPKEPFNDENEVIFKAQERFKINTDYIWPEVKKLVEMDMRNEEQRQMMKEFRQKQKELEQKREELKQANIQRDKQKQKKLKEEIEGLKKELNPFNQLPEDVKEEFQKQIDKTIKETTERLNKEIEERENQLKETKRRQEELDKEIKELEEKLKQASGKEKEELEKEIKRKKAEKLSQEIKKEQAEQDLKKIQDSLEKIESGEEMPYPEDKLSDKIKDELDKLFEKLPKEKKKKIEEKSKEELEDFEDVINKEIEGKLNEDKLESHKERREKEKVERETAIKSLEEEKIRKNREERLEKIRREEMSKYEKAREKVVYLIDELYYSLRKILLPEEYGGEELGWPSGKELDITRAIQSEMSKDIRERKKIWIREEIPEIKDYRFWHLIDVSGSMEGEKIEETFKGFIVAEEAIDRLENLNSNVITIHQGITGFHNRIFHFKNFNQRHTKEIENKLSTMLERVDDSDAGTNTYLGTKESLQKLKKDLGKTGNFLLTFSDGEPNHDIRNELKKLLKETKDERKKLKIKIGLIWLGESEDEKKLKKLVEEYGYDFGLVMSAVKSKEKNKKNFAENLADLLKTLVESMLK